MAPHLVSGIEGLVCNNETVLLSDCLSSALNLSILPIPFISYKFFFDDAKKTSMLNNLTILNRSFSIHKAHSTGFCFARVYMVFRTLIFYLQFNRVT